MKRLLTICVLLISTAVFSVAQQRNFDKSVLLENWYVEANAGAQALFSTDASRLSPKNRISSFFAVTGGKWITESFGFRLRVEGYAYRGYSNVDGLYLDDPVIFWIWGNNDPRREHVNIMPDGSYKRNLRYINTHADLQFSLFNFLDLKAKDKWDVIMAAGLGYNRLISFKGNSGVNSISTNFGVMAKYRLNKSLDINMEVGTAIMPDHFDGRISGKMYENNLAVSFGVTYKFKKRGFKNKSVPVEVVREVERIIKDTVTVTKEITVEKKVFNEPFVLSTISFRINQHNPIPGQYLEFENIVKYLNANPHAKIRLNGYADSKTGTPEYNLGLSTKRAAAVRSILINKYKIDPSKIQAQGIGSNAQPYSQNQYNRAVLVTIIEN